MTKRTSKKAASKAASKPEAPFVVNFGGTPGYQHLHAHRPETKHRTLASAIRNAKVLGSGDNAAIVWRWTKWSDLSTAQRRDNARTSYMGGAYTVYAVVIDRGIYR